MTSDIPRLISLAWRKSSRSNGQGGACVEAAALAWHKSSHSNGQGGNCVEAASCPDHVALRDSKLAHLSDFPVLSLSAADWRSFTTAVKSGRLD